MKINNNYRHHAMAAGVATLFATPLSHAVLEEVIVTAQKREENVQTVPIAVSALGEETLRTAA